MISGTSKSSLNLGPINGHFWAPGPRIYGFSYAQIPRTILESIWEHPENIIFAYMRIIFSKIFEIFEKVNPPLCFKIVFVYKL